MALARKSDIPRTNSTPTVSTNIPAVPSDGGSFVANCVDVLHDEGVCIVDCPELGEEARVPFSQDVGIRKGSAVHVSVGSNVPRVTRCLNFGNKVACVFDPASTDVNNFFKTVEATSTGGSEKAVAAPAMISLEDSEKAFVCDFSGIKAGKVHSILFYGPNSRIICEEGKASVLSDEVLIMSLAGSVLFTPPLDKGDIGFVSEKIHKLDEERENAFEIIREYRGDVAAAMGLDEFTIDGFPGAEKLNISSIASLFVILDEDVAKYKRDSKIVSNEYINRELKVPEGSNTATNKKLAGRSKMPTDFFDSYAISGKSGSMDVAIVYLKAISYNGDVYEFNAGERTEIKTENRNIYIGKNSDINFGEYEKLFQNDYSSIQYPASEGTIIRTENYAQIITDIKGEQIKNSYKEVKEKKINTRTEYEIDTASGIETKEVRESPVTETVSQTTSLRMEKHKDATSSEVHSNEHFTNGDDKMSIIRNPKSSSALIMSVSNGQNNDNFNFGNSGLSVSVKDGNIMMETKALNVKSKQSVFSGKTLFSDGIFVKGDFVIEAKNIFMRASAAFFVDCENFIVDSKHEVYIQYDDYFFISSTREEVDSENKPRHNSYIYLNPFDIYLDGETTQMHAAKSVNAFSDEYGYFGAAKRATFYKGEEG